VNIDMKICSKCDGAKSASKDFYVCQGKYRSECKVCTIAKNTVYQRRVQPWKNRYVDNEEQRSYMVEYYAKNKEKFAEYRRKFKEKYPEYHKEYARKRKDERL
jgi:hypothetical protein